MSKPRSPLTDPKTGAPLPERAQPGYYPGFSTFEQRAFWDEATRDLVVRRVEEVPPLRFFDADERLTAEAVFDRIVPQDDRALDRRVPIVAAIDDRLHARRLAGYRFEGMPEEPEAMKRVLAMIDGAARAVDGCAFHELEIARREAHLDALRRGDPLGGDARFEGLPLRHVWRMLLEAAIEAYYEHPWAWDEIGFGGPAYPRGYMRLENGEREPWEVDEARYEWRAPVDTCSDAYDPARDPAAGGVHPKRRT